MKILTTLSKKTTKIVAKIINKKAAKDFEKDFNILIDDYEDGEMFRFQYPIDPIIEFNSGISLLDQELNSNYKKQMYLPGFSYFEIIVDEDELDIKYYLHQNKRSYFEVDVYNINI